MSELKYISKDYKPKGNLEGFPLEIVDKMIERQVEQGNEPNVSVFEDLRGHSKSDGGFDWQLTQEEKDGYGFWLEVISNRDFNLFFQKYPKKEKAADLGRKATGKKVVENVELPRQAEKINKIERGQWIPAKDFGVFEVDEHGAWEALHDVKFLGAIINDEGDRIHFGLFMFTDTGFLEWDNEEMEFIDSDIPVENLTHCAPYPKLPEPEVEGEIWELVNEWCEGQYKDVPDMNRRYLMDKILDWYNARVK